MADAKHIWEFLLERIQNPYGVAGLMGNLYAESCLNPKNLQNSYENRLKMTDEEYTKAVDEGSYPNFAVDQAGYGLAQWTYPTRKQGLLNYCRGKGASIGDLDAQLEYLWRELQGYTAVLDVLRGAKSVREASDAVLLKFERPADTGERMREKRASFGQEYYNKYAVTVRHTGREFMTAADLCDKLIDIAKNYETIYMYACYGFKVDTYNINKKTKQNLNGWYTPAHIASLMKVANRTPTWWGFDCVNLLKGILWGWDGDESDEHGGAVYGAHGVPDTNANGMITKCYDVSTDFSMGLLPGEGLWLEGHWGTYVGNGLAVECTGRWENKVQITAVHNLGKVPGYNGRNWTKHGKLPWIAYDNVIPDTPGQPVTPSTGGHPTLRRGDKGAAVKELQQDLIKLGYSVGASGADGDFGAATERGVKAFQSIGNLEVDGIVGKRTWAAIDKALAAQSQNMVVIKAGTWNVRSGPGTGYASIGICKGGDSFPPSGELDDGWVGIIYGSGKAWVSKKAIAE